MRSLEACLSLRGHEESRKTTAPSINVALDAMSDVTGLLNETPDEDRPMFHQRLFKRLDDLERICLKIQLQGATIQGQNARRERHMLSIFRLVECPARKGRQKRRLGN